MSELELCPFCGGEAELSFAHRAFRYVAYDGTPKDTGYYYTVRCTECGCRIGIYENPAMAIEAWNRRKKSDE